MAKPILIIGAGGHAKSVAEIALAMGYEIKAFISPESPRCTLLGYRIQAELPQELDIAEDSIAIGIGSNWTREKVWLELREAFPLTMFPALMHPSASVVALFTSMHQSVLPLTWEFSAHSTPPRVSITIA